MSDRDKKDERFNTIKFSVQFEVYPDILRKHFKESLKGVQDISKAVEDELKWLETSGIYLNQIRVKK
jgi:hypothetical protein